MKIYITEQQHNKIFEAMKPGFSLDEMVAQRTFKNRLNYCMNMLGKPSGSGSSRVVFDIDDETVLKLARNRKGIAQNLEEIRLGTEPYLSSFPRIMNGTDENNGLWIVSERVLPATEEDFEKVLNVPFAIIDDFIWSVTACGKRGYNEYAENKRYELYELYENNYELIDLFNDIHELYMGFDNSISDLRRIENWGMCLRDGQPSMVILDSGLSQEVYDNMYNPFRKR